MRYITIKRYKRNETHGVAGRHAVNIPYGSAVEESGGKLFYNGVEICGDHSAVMREYFARDDDGLGLERGKLSQAIIQTMLARPGETREQHQARWDVIWNDVLVCPKYRKTVPESGDWLWSIEFFNAPIEDLKYIAALVGAGKGN